ncbi:unnamed protein product [Meloidogyne enterolobii]|uniref:Uncharacterized protein n=1 Tax=Meloidogyne enterolobii TaxID=390850 RepID=A0ACB0ZIC1_MELEN
MDSRLPFVFFFFFSIRSRMNTPALLFFLLVIKWKGTKGTTIGASLALEEVLSTRKMRDVRLGVDDRRMEVKGEWKRGEGGKWGEGVSRKERQAHTLQRQG